MKKKGVYFSTDALIALIIIFLTILVVYPTIKHASYNSVASSDMITVLSSIKVGEMDNSYARDLISQGKITDLNQSVMEQIGEFYAKDMEEASLLTSSILGQLGSKENIGLWINNQFIASKNSTSFENSKDAWTSRQIISGIEKGKEVKGYSSRAFLSKANNAEYFYFGGYIGDGNISALMNYSGKIQEAKIEIATGKDFDLYINNIFSGHYENSSSPITPAVYNINAYLNNFHSGTNIIKFSAQNLYIAGGYIKISHDNSGIYEAPVKHYLPGVEGIINLYDSFYVPGNLNSMSVYLHYKTSYSLFFNIGNVTIFNSSSSVENTTMITNSQLINLLDYSSLSKKTIPIRTGIQGMQKSGIGNADVILITDLSGSMNWRLDSDNDGVTRNCNDPNLYNSDTKRISLAKCLDKQVVDIILNTTGNRLSAVSFTTSSPAGTILTNNSAVLKNSINSYSANGGTCICCAINRAYNILNQSSGAGRQKFIIVMTDGIAGYCCGGSYNNCNIQGTSTNGVYDCNGDSSDCSTNNCNGAVRNANYSSCRANKDLGSTIYSIGFGPVATCSVANNTLQWIAQCGKGKAYASSDALLLQNIYQTISHEIVQLSYSEQEAKMSGVFNSTILFPDSYISLDYTSSSLPYGLAITSETGIFNNYDTNGSFFIPEDSEIAEANVISYSGSKWTDRVFVLNNNSWQQVFSLANFGSNYLNLGDAYVVNLPLSYLTKGNNTAKITTGLGVGNSSGGSPYDKAVYTIIKPSSGYSQISSIASGCVWHIEFEDSTNLTMSIPGNYSGTSNCYYRSSQIAYNDNDAINNAIFSLLSSLDLNSNHKVETKFTEQDLQITSNEVSGIPYTWNSEVQVRTWE